MMMMVEKERIIIAHANARIFTQPVSENFGSFLDLDLLAFISDNRGSVALRVPSVEAKLA